MKVFTTTIAILSLVVVFFPIIIDGQSYECLDTSKTGVTDDYELGRVGDIGKTNIPPATLSYMEATGALEGELFVEVSREQWTSTITTAFVEVYAGIEENSVDCKVDGTPIEDGVVVVSNTVDYNYNDAFSPSNEEECFPRTKNGEVVAVGFTFANPFDDKEGATKIWYPKDGTNDDGLINFCVRVCYKIIVNGEDELVSFIDTKIRGNLDISATFNSFGEAVPITLEQATKFETELECKIDVNAFLCLTPEEKERMPSGQSYGLGQSFRICVDIADTYVGNYEVTGFNSIVCRNSIVNRTLITDGGTTDPLTSVVTDVDGFKSFGGASIATENAAAVESVVTSVYFAEKASADQFDCDGEVELKYIGTEEDGVCKQASPPTGPPSRCIDLCKTQRENKAAVPQGTDMRNLVLNSINDGIVTSQIYGEVINCWNISLLTSLEDAFRDQPQFNQPLDCWDTSGITKMDDMFRRSAFNSDISGWNVGSVTSMSAMFVDQPTFNQNINAWNTTSVKDMSAMFAFVTNFNSDLSGWDVNSVTRMTAMFKDASSFNQSLCDWRIQTEGVHEFFSNSGCLYAGSRTDEYLTGCAELCNVTRRLGIKNNNNNNNIINNRILQEGGGDTVAPFTTTIKISTTTVNKDSAASTPFCRRNTIIANLAVVAIGFTSSLMIVM